MRLRSRAGLGLALVCPVWAAAAGGFSAHPNRAVAMPTPFFARVLAADRIAFATVDAVEPDRIRVTEAEALVGRVPPRFAIKRDPTARASPRPGERRLWLLAGARPPFVDLERDAPLEPLGSASDADRWRQRVRALRATRGDPEALLELHLSWLDGKDPEARTLAAQALLSPRPPWRLSEARARERARRALDPSAAAPTRRVSAVLAVQEPSVLRGLLARLPPRGADPATVDLILRAGVTAGRLEEVRLALARCLAATPDLRRVALGLAPWVMDAPLRSSIERIAQQDPDPAIRKIAASVLRGRKQRRPRGAAASEPVSPPPP